MPKTIHAIASLALTTLFGFGSACSDSSMQATDDGGVPDGSSAQDLAVGPDLMPVSCSYRYCENFESYNIGPVANGATLGPWTASVGGTTPTMTVDAVRPYSGGKALHVTVTADASAHGTLHQAAAGGLVPGNNLYGRAMIYYSDKNGNGLALGVHSWIFNATGTSTAAGGGVSMNLGGGATKFQLNYHPPAPAAEQSVQGGTQTAGAWHCVQWEYDGSGTPAKNEGRVWVDGTMAIDVLPAKGWQFATPWTAFDFGFTHYQTLTNPVDIYLDDFALNDTMIPCP